MTTTLLACVVALASCGGGGDASTGTARAGVPVPADGGAGPDADPDAGARQPDASGSVCSSGVTWARGDHGSSAMNPGLACIACHTTMHGPPLTIAGTVYPTGHEPDLCDGADGANGALVVITGADGQTVTLTPNAAGNFDTGAPVALPFTARVTIMGREHAMVAMQTSGDCNGCHTQNGVNGAPGRITLP